MFVEWLAGVRDCLADGVWVDLQQFGEHLLGAVLALMDQGEHNAVGIGEQRAQASSWGVAASAPAPGVAALRGLSGSGGASWATSSSSSWPVMPVKTGWIAA